MLGDFELKLFGLEAADVESLFDGGGEVSLLKLTGRDVDGDGEFGSEPSLQCGDLFA